MSERSFESGESRRRGLVKRVRETGWNWLIAYGNAYTGRPTAVERDAFGTEAAAKQAQKALEALRDTAEADVLVRARSLALYGKKEILEKSRWEVGKPFRLDVMDEEGEDVVFQLEEYPDRRVAIMDGQAFQFEDETVFKLDGLAIEAVTYPEIKALQAHLFEAQLFPGRIDVEVIPSE